MGSRLNEYMKCPELAGKTMTAEDAATFVKDGMTIGASGFTPSGYPKAVPLALAKMVERIPGAFRIDLLTGASVGDELDGALARAGVIRRRLPYQTNDSVRDSINSGETLFLDVHLSHVPQRCRYGFYGPLDLAIVEAVMITPEGHIVPSTSVGATPTFVRCAKSVIVEINTSQPLDLVGMHDIYVPADPPAREPIPLTAPDQRIGTTYIPCDPGKIVAVVETDIKDSTRSLAPVDDVSRAIASHLIEFLEHEVEKGRLPLNLLPLQSGVGSVANAVLSGLLDSRFEGMSLFSEVIQDSALDLLDAGRITCASATSLTVSPERLPSMYARMRAYRDKIVLRPQEISNNPEVIRRLGSIAINTAIEVDIYGNVNSTNILGSKMMNGIGGSGDFARNAYLTVFATGSVARNGDISSIVPMVSHVDHTEHDVDVIVTEHGLADLRRLAPRERAWAIIERCAHPDFRPLLRDYAARAERAGGHTPHLLREALSWHTRFQETGTMRLLG